MEKSNLQKYLNAISNHSLETLTSIISKNIVLILPTGKLIMGKNEFIEFHRQ